MIEFAIAIATAVVVAGLGLLGAALIGQAILDFRDWLKRRRGTNG